MMRYRMSFASLLPIVAAFLWAAAQAQPTTLNTRFDGYTYASNVIGYVNMTMDYCDVQAAVASGNFSVALGIYTTGKNSWNGLIRRTFYRFATFTPAAGVVEPLHNALAMGRNASWLDTMIKDAISKRNGPLALGLIQVAALKYFFHEVDEGFTNVATYLNDTANNEILISDATGAPHNVDEAFSLWAGGNPRACTTLSSWAAQLGADLETTFVGRSYINSAMTLALNELLAAARTGNAVSYNNTRTMVQRYITLLGLQGVMHSVYSAEAAVTCKRPAAQIAESQSSIAVHWTYLEPMLLVSNVRPALVQDLYRALTNSTPSYSRALPAIRAAVSALGRRMAEVGEPRFDLITSRWANCKPNSPPAAGRSLL